MKNKISQLRKQHKITQEELANEVGVTRQTITSIETGKYIASLPLAFKIAKFFDMSIEDIFSIEEDD
ncbi:helix-turn-helix transcriptional regulator [uncultured Sneathia sp.]|uniref:helix-turn-helix transcriptional regulator n=1 Tax=uncultured Sneathia sp. TaxID=278067 RepID=UPI002592C0C7|nr:helix-turn-helix transcriptional regulator [uncultured Sneathia sp.]